MQPHTLSVTRLATTMFLVGAATFVVHEFFHWLVGTLLGYPMRITPNQVGPLAAMLPAHHTAMTAAGPIATYVQAAVGYWLVVKRASPVGFAMVYMAFFMRLVAMGVSVFNPNDEARISLELGIGQWTLPLLVCGVCTGRPAGSAAPGWAGVRPRRSSTAARSRCCSPTICSPPTATVTIS